MELQSLASIRSLEPTTHEIARLKLLRSYAILDTCRDVVFDRLVLAAAQLFRAPVAGIAFLDADRLWFKAQLGLDLSEEPGRIGSCLHAILSKELLVVEDTATDARGVMGPFVTGQPFYRFYAGAPLIASAGFRLGTLCVLDYLPRSAAPGDVTLLYDLAQQVMQALERRRNRVRCRRARHPIHASL